MRKWFNVSLALVVLGHTSSYILACSAKSNQDNNTENPTGWDNIDKNTFTKITGVTGEISSIDLTNGTFYAGSTAGRIYKSTNQQTFTAITTTGIVPAGQIFSSLILDNQGYLYVAFKDIVGNLGGVYRTVSSTSTALARYAASPLAQPITGLFLNKVTNDSYAAMENSDLETVTLYKWNSTPTATLPTIIPNSTIETNGYTDLTLDNAGDIYFVINNVNNSRASVFRYDIGNTSAPELILSLADTTISSITSNNNVIYLAAENVNTDTSNIYQSIDGKRFVKSNVETDWTISQIIFDDENHLYAAGINNKLYAAVVNNNIIDNFNIISNQTFNNIYSLNYEQNVLIVGGQDEFSWAQVNNFEFTKK